jgi:hypothetical protein
LTIEQQNKEDENVVGRQLCKMLYCIMLLAMKDIIGSGGSFGCSLGFFEFPKPSSQAPFAEADSGRIHPFRRPFRLLLVFRGYKSIVLVVCCDFKFIYSTS